MNVYSNAAAMRHLEMWQTAVAQNLSAGPQPGYKAVEVSLVKPAAAADGKQLPLQSDYVRDFSAAPARRTDRALDVAIGGEGFIVARDGNGQRALLRNGELQTSPNGRLMNSAGWEIEGREGPIEARIDDADPTIDESGTVWQGGTRIGRVRVATVDDPNTLLYDGRGYRLPAGVDPEVALRNLDEPALRGGYLEEGNHSPLRSMITLMQISRSFEANQKALQAQDGAVEQTIRALT